VTCTGAAGQAFHFMDEGAARTCGNTLKHMVLLKIGTSLRGIMPAVRFGTEGSSVQDVIDSRRETPASKLKEDILPCRPPPVIQASSSPDIESASTVSQTSVARVARVSHTKQPCNAAPLHIVLQMLEFQTRMIPTPKGHPFKVWHSRQACAAPIDARAVCRCARLGEIMRVSTAVIVSHAFWVKVRNGGKFALCILQSCGEP
jgi:hypothetical protein